MKTEFYALGLIGYPLKSSFSPGMHHAALRALGLEGEYRLLPVPPLPEGAARLAALMEEMRCGILYGLNVTIPHKLSALPFLDEVSSEARAIGAVNTILRRDGALVGLNTDAAGFMADLQRLLPSPPSPRAGDPEGQSKTALVLGAGGSARAVAYALALDGWRVVVAARRLEAAQALCAHLTPHLPHGEPPKLQPVLLSSASLSALNEQPLMHETTLIVNATPVGMVPHTQASPWPTEVPLPAKAVVYDLIYNPAETLFMRCARQAGLRAQNGLGMLLEQAILAFEAWTGRPAPRAAMQAALLRQSSNEHHP